MFVRQSAVQDVGLLDESFFFFGEETDWCRSFRQRGWRVCFAPVGEIIHYRGASTNQISHRRGVLLTRALIDLHRKHGGPIAASVAWAILLVFNLTRYLGWFLTFVVRREAHSSQRRDYFRGILKEFPALRGAAGESV
jgi:GT2 family glycosyltransferase